MIPNDLRTAFPNFKDVPDAVIQPAINASNVFFEDPTRYGDALADAQNNLVAHFVVMRLPDQGLDPGTNDATHEKRQSLDVARDPELLRRQAADPFMRTSYGQMYCYYRGLAGLGGAGALLSEAAESKLPDFNFFEISPFNG